MDVFATASTALEQVYKITIFIRSVVLEIKSYEAYTHEIQAKLEHEFLFLEEFKSLMFEENDAAISYIALPDIHKKDIQNILEALSRILSQHALVAVKHGFNVIGAQDTTESLTGNARLNDIQSQSSKWRAKFQQLRAKFTKLDWALFDKDTILKLLRDYSEWTQRLRQITYMILLMAGSIGQTKRLEIAERSRGKNLGLDRVAKRQIRAESLGDIGPLDGSLLTDRTWQKPYQLAKYQDPSGFGAVPVLLEKHSLNQNLGSRAKDAEAGKKAILEPVRSLAALLCGTTTTTTNDSEDTDPLKTLECVGYSDQAYPDHALLIYKYPFDQNGIRSLHSEIKGHGTSANTIQNTKPSLGDRFFLAYSLSLSTLGIHVSGWVHKGLRSQGILLLKDTGSSRLTPHLIGWGTARRTIYTESSIRRYYRENGFGNWGYDEEERFDLEVNLYRHPERYDKPQEIFTPAHDLYSLGVILLEIGCWKTMSTRFEKPISIAKAKMKLPPVLLVKEQILSVARSTELKQEMGIEYARAVERCLLNDFDVDGDDPMYTILMRNFRKLVIDKLQLGLSVYIWCHIFLFKSEL